MNKNSVYVVLAAIALVLLVLVIGYKLGSGKASPTLLATPTPTVTISVSPTDTLTPTVTVSPSVTPTQAKLDIEDTFVTMEPLANKTINGVNYSFSFYKCSNSHCDHYLLPTSKVSKSSMLLNTPDLNGKYLLSANRKALDSAAGNSYYELIDKITILTGTVYGGVISDLGDGNSYHVFTQCATETGNATCYKYLLDVTKTSSSLKKILITSRVGKNAYITSSFTSRGSAAGTSYFNLTTGLYIAFK